MFLSLYYRRETKHGLLMNRVTYYYVNNQQTHILMYNHSGHKPVEYNDNQEEGLGQDKVVVVDNDPRISQLQEEFRYIYNHNNCLVS